MGLRGWGRRRRATSRWGQGRQGPLPAGRAGASPVGDRSGDHARVGFRSGRLAGVPRAPESGPGRREAETVWEGGRRAGRRSPARDSAAHLQGPAQQPTSAGEPEGHARPLATQPPPTHRRLRGRADAGGPAGAHSPQQEERGPRSAPETPRSRAGSAAGTTGKREERPRPAWAEAEPAPTHQPPGRLRPPQCRQTLARTQDSPGSDPRWAGREAKGAGPALDSLWLVNTPHLTLETLKRGQEPPLQPAQA